MYNELMRRVLLPLLALVACDAGTLRPRADALDGPPYDSGADRAAGEKGGGDLRDAAAKCGNGACDPGESAASCPADCNTSTVWRPKPGTSWQWQLSGTLDTSLNVQMYDIDLVNTPAATIAALRAQGRAVICYFSAGSYEDVRPDAGDFPEEVKGNDLEGWNELWLDIRSTAVRAIMQKRLDLAKSKGCTGVEPDNVDGYANDSGFPLTASDQIAYNTFIAGEAHKRGLSVGLKNDTDQAAQLQPSFDWALSEECLEYDECSKFSPFIAAGKAVFHVEYAPDASATSVCPQVKSLQFDTLIKNMNLDAWREACP
jgi:hypothetical protein